MLESEAVVAGLQDVAVRGVVIDTIEQELCGADGYPSATADSLTIETMVRTDYLLDAVKVLVEFEVI